MVLVVNGKVLFDPSNGIKCFSILTKFSDSYRHTRLPKRRRLLSQASSVMLLTFFGHDKNMELRRPTPATKIATPRCLIAAPHLMS